MPARRVISAAAAVLAVGWALGLGWALAQPVAAKAPNAQLRAFVCKRASDAPARGVSVTAVMRPLPGTEALALRFRLLRKTSPNGPWVALKGGDLGRWIYPSDPTLGSHPADVWVLQKPVVDLAAPAVYYYRVSFRWIAAGHVLAQTVRVSSRCHQPELRPDLQVSSIQVEPLENGSNQDRYTAVIRNLGTTGAGPFDVVFSADGATQVRTVGWLKAHAQVTKSFLGPICSSADPPTVKVDPSASVDDSNRANNSLKATCPAA